MTKNVFIASGYCDTAVKHQIPRDHIVTHLEFTVGDEVTLMRKGDHDEIWMVYDDSRPSELIYKLPAGYQ